MSGGAILMVIVGSILGVILCFVFPPLALIILPILYMIWAS